MLPYHSILLEKMSIYGCSEEVVSWFSSYLRGRRQGVLINATMSKLLQVDVGVPQGSILGPLLYTIYTNELPSLIYSMEDREITVEPEENEGQSGHICCYADDTTMTALSTNHSDLTEKLSQNYEKVSNFMNNNRLKLNDDKSHLLVFNTSNRRAKTHSLVKNRTSIEVI